MTKQVEMVLEHLKNGEHSRVHELAERYDNRRDEAKRQETFLAIQGRVCELISGHSNPRGPVCSYMLFDTGTEGLGGKVRGLNGKVFVGEYTNLTRSRIIMRDQGQDEIDLRGDCRIILGEPEGTHLRYTLHDDKREIDVSKVFRDGHIQAVEVGSDVPEFLLETLKYFMI